MAKEEKKVAAAASEELNGIRKSNILGDGAITAAIDEINKEKNENQKNDAKIALCTITYYNAKCLIEKHKRSREDSIMADKLEASKKIFERFIGFECEVKDQKLIPTKKKIAEEDRLTSAEVRAEKDKLNEEIRKKIIESDKKYNKELQELRNSYEGRYHWYETWD